MQGPRVPGEGPVGSGMTEAVLNWTVTDNIPDAEKGSS